MNTILSLPGLGAYASQSNKALDEDDALTLIESWCTHPELYQDIKIEMRKHYKDLIKYYSHTENFPVVQVRIYDAHKVAVIAVYRASVRMKDCKTEEGYVRLHSILKNEVYVSLSDDGLITDIVGRPAKMNPGNARNVGPRPVAVAA